MPSSLITPLIMDSRLRGNDIKRVADFGDNEVVAITKNSGYNKNTLFFVHAG